MRNDQIKVLMLLPNLRVSNGVTSYAMNYFRRLDHSRVRMDFAVYKDRDNPYEEEIRAAGSNVFILPPLKSVLSHYNACRKILNEGKYDIVHDNSLLVTYPMMKVAGKHSAVRILHSHNSKLGDSAKKEKRNARFLPHLLKQTDKYAACSDLAAKALFGDASYEFIPNVIDAENYCFNTDTRAEIRRVMKATDKKIIATVGRVSAQKNPFFALDVFDIVAERDPEAEYWWIGSGALDKTVSDYVATMKHGDQVRLLGSRNDMRDLYQAIDLFFLPSLFEGLPITGVEAQAMGLPCVISDTVTKEVVYTDLVRFVSLQESKEKWAGIICELLNRTGEREGRTEDLIGSVFASNNAGVHLEQYYRNLL